MFAAGVLTKRRPDTLRILLVDASSTELGRVERALRAAGMHPTIERVQSLPELTRALNDFAPHVVLNDHAHPELDPHTTLETLRVVRPVTPLFLLSKDLDEPSTTAVLRAGAEGFIMKANLGRLAPAIAAALPMRRRLERLTPRQLQVLRLVAEGQTSPLIARKLRISLKTVETHRSQIMHRLDIHDLVRLVHYAVRVGLVVPRAHVR